MVCHYLKTVEQIHEYTHWLISYINVFASNKVYTHASAGPVVLLVTQAEIYLPFYTSHLLLCMDWCYQVCYTVSQDNYPTKSESYNTATFWSPLQRLEPMKLTVWSVNFTYSHLDAVRSPHKHHSCCHWFVPYQRSLPYYSDTVIKLTEKMPFSLN